MSIPHCTSWYREPFTFLEFCPFILLPNWIGDEQGSALLLIVADLEVTPQPFEIHALLIRGNVISLAHAVECVIV